MSSAIQQTTVKAAVVECEIEIAAPPAKVFGAFVDEINEWFYESEETRHDRITCLEPELGGRFYIASRDGSDQNLLALVTMIKKNREIRLRGDCTIPEAFVANMTVKFEEAGDDTRVKVIHRMAGAFSDDLPAGFESGWMDGLAKLKSLVERQAASG